MNSLEEMRKVDAANMLEVLWNLPEQCEEAWQRGMEAPLRDLEKVWRGPEAVDQVVVTGLGGSAIGGDLLRVYAQEEAAIPFAVNRDYLLPAYVGLRTLVFAVSYSGNTEETLSAYDDARRRGAKIVALTSGGKLAEKAQADGFPVILVPGGISPRSASGYLFLPMIAALQRLGILADASAQVEETCALLRRMREKLRPACPEAENLAKQLARKFYERLPVIYGTSGTTETVAVRWKGQINENSKAMAYYNVFPELNHNEIVGTERPEALLKRLELVFLVDNTDHPRVQKRRQITQELIGERVGGISWVEAQGDSRLARIYSLIYVGDYASVYLALLYGIDPTPVRLIDRLKQRLAEVN